ncbi:MAG: hypothetical protein JJD97_12450 [Gemmatimonadaceae bacterium]|nr:hypothetical protein [Gemmatimonadaceae bacterium]
MPLAFRHLVAAAAALSLAAVPIYPGATFDAAGSKEASARNPKFPYKVYVTPDSYEKVVAFYKSKGGKESSAIGVGNSAQQKMGMYAFGDSLVALNWPADVKDKSGKVVSRTGTRIAVGE